MLIFQQRAKSRSNKVIFFSFSFITGRTDIYWYTLIETDPKETQSNIVIRFLSDSKTVRDDAIIIAVVKLTK